MSICISEHTHTCVHKYSGTILVHIHVLVHKNSGTKQIRVHNITILYEIPLLCYLSLWIPEHTDILTLGSGNGSKSYLIYLFKKEFF